MYPLSLRIFFAFIVATPPQSKYISLGSGLTSSDTGIIIAIIVGIVVLTIILILIRYCYDRNSSLSAHLTNVQTDEMTDI